MGPIRSFRFGIGSIGASPTMGLNEFAFSEVFSLLLSCCQRKGVSIGK